MSGTVFLIQKWKDSIKENDHLRRCFSTSAVHLSHKDITENQGFYADNADNLQQLWENVK